MQQHADPSVGASSDRILALCDRIDAATLEVQEELRICAVEDALLQVPEETK